MLAGAHESVRARWYFGADRRLNLWEVTVRVIQLNGAWRVRRSDTGSEYNAKVPGCIHADLIRQGVLEDPNWRDNELKAQWVGTTGWTYARTFKVDQALLDACRVVLSADGLDTLATVSVNGHRVASTDNMHRYWEWDIRSTLRLGENEIAVHFEPVSRYLSEHGARDPLPAWNEYYGHKHRGWLRKMHSNFGWDWSPVLVSCGIWRDIRIKAFSGARLSDVRVWQEHNNGAVTVGVDASVEVVDTGAYGVRVSVRRKGRVVGEAGAYVVNREPAVCSVPIDAPELWWPAGMGEQPLYEVHVELLGDGAVVLDSWRKRIGLRTLRLVRERDQWGESFAFLANGRPFFVKGTNWVPPLAYPAWPEGDDWKTRLRDAVAANMNMVRMWGGAYFAPEVFFDYCDEIGLTVWQDLLFACGPYPLYDHAFVASIEAETRDNVRALRHHPCIALWCGNNELESTFIGPVREGMRMAYADYDRVFSGSFPRIIAELDPQASYWPASPVTSANLRTGNDPGSGDIHIWEIWFSEAPFENYRNYPHRFISEFGFQSLPHPRTIASFTEPGERQLNSRMLDFHQRSGPGNRHLMKFILEWFRLPEHQGDIAILSQLVQANCLKVGVEHFRRNMPRTMGTLIWQLNDCWPCMSWSSIDHGGRWKALHWFAKRFYAPVLVSALERPTEACADIWLSSDLAQLISGEVRAVVTALDGSVVAEKRLQAQVGAGQSVQVGTIDLEEHVRALGTRGILLWLEFAAGGTVVSSNLAILERPRLIEWEPSGLRAQVQPLGGSEYEVLVSARKPSLWAWLDTVGFDTRFDDNFKPVRPGEVWRVHASAPQGVTQTQFTRALTARDVHSTYV